jgi:transcription-repair coupling factor (superfamily II helicase)
LIKTAAIRATRPGQVAEPDSSYPSFVDRFPYEETEDQDRAISEVLDDLASGKPMDRLVCGDVGFGKTRSRCGPLSSRRWPVTGRVIGPTTLLARQHYSNFAARLPGISNRGWAPVAASARGGSQGDQGKA